MFGVDEKNVRFSFFKGILEQELDIWDDDPASIETIKQALVRFEFRVVFKVFTTSHGSGDCWHSFTLPRY